MAQTLLTETKSEKESVKLLEEAIQNFSEAIGINPNAAIYYHERAKVYMATGREQEAIADSEKALDLDPDVEN